MAKWRRTAWALLGSALVVRGEISTGLAALDSATSEGWNPRAYLYSARAHRALGDTSGMLRDFAHLAADPEYGSYADSARALGNQAYGRIQWTRMRDAARARMRTATLQDASPQPLPRRARVLAATGIVHNVRELAEGQVTVLAYWSPTCGPSRRSLPEVAELHDWLGGRGARLVLVTDKPASPEVDRLLASAEISFPTYFDTYGEGRDALKKFSTPSFWVVDASGTILFETTELSSIRRQVLSLLPPERADTARG